MTRRGTAVLAAILMAAACASAMGREPAFAEYRAVQESLSRVHPRMRASWLREHGLDDSPYTTFRKPDSGSGLSCIGRWSYGPSYDVDGRATPAETLLALARGSGVSLIRFARTDSVEIELLADVNAGGIMKRVAVRDSLLYVGSTAGLEIWSITDERNPVRRSWIATALNDFAVQESLAYIIGSDDSFKAYSIADPASPRRVGACRDSGSTVAVAAGAAFIGDRWGLYAVDITNPANPHRVGSWGSAIEGVSARGHLCYVTTFNPNTPGDIGFYILDVSTPSSPMQIGFLDQAGGCDVHLIDTLAYCSGDGDMTQLNIVSVADTTHPRQVGAAGTPGWNWGVWASGLSRSAFVAADWTGMQVFDVSISSAPVRDAERFAADQAMDVAIDSGVAYIANNKCGLQILDVSDPASTELLANYDTAGQIPFMQTAAARDSFAFVSAWAANYFRVLDVTDPTRPLFAGDAPGFNMAEDIVVQDSFAYVAEDRRLQIYNVARPRAPVLVGSCVLPDDSYDMDMRDTLAFIGNVHSLQIVNTSSPTSPSVVGTAPIRALGVAVVDTIAYLTSTDAAVFVLNEANVASPVVLDTLPLANWATDIVVVGNRVYASGDDISVIDVSDPTNLRLLQTIPAVAWTRRLEFFPPYLYAACSDGGVCVYETTAVGIAEERQADVRTAVGMRGSVVRDELVIELPAAGGGEVMLSAYDMSGRCVESRVLRGQGPEVRYSLVRLPAGVYVLRVRSSGQTQAFKVVKL